jgi:hypothetical protein
MVQVFISVYAGAEDIWKGVELMHLKGLSSIAVGSSSFQCWGSNAEKIGVTERKIRNLVESKFRQCGIEVFDRIENSSRRDGADISIDFKSIELSSLSGVIYLNLRIYEDANIERNNLYTPGRTWERWAMLSYSKNFESEKEILSYINDWMDEFSNLYLTVNPRKFIYTY